MRLTINPAVSRDLPGQVDTISGREHPTGLFRSCIPPARVQMNALNPDQPTTSSKSLIANALLHPAPGKVPRLST